MNRVGYVFNSERIIGGGELSFIDLADAIRGFNVEPVAIVPGDGEVSERLKALEIETVRMPFGSLRGSGILRFPSGVRRVARMFDELKLNLVHTNGARCMLYAGPAARRAAIPCVWHVRVLGRDRILDRIRARYANIVIANSKAVAAVIDPYVPQPTGIEVIYNGIKLDEFASAEPADLKAEFGIPDGPVILDVGRFSRWKAFDDLLKACNIVNRKGVKCSCLLVGEALSAERNYENELKELARSITATNAVVFAGWREDIPSIMKASSMLVFPSHHEAFGRVIVEAWACGLPVVATNEGGPAELITHEVDGLLVKAGDVDAIARAIISILQDSALARRLVTAGRDKAQAFSLLNHARRVNEIYGEVLTRGSRFSVPRSGLEPRNPEP